MDDLEADSLETPQVSEAELILDTYKAWQDIQQLLEGHLTPEEAYYGPWTPQMRLLRWDCESQGPAMVQSELLGLLKHYRESPDSLPC